MSIFVKSAWIVSKEDSDDPEDIITFLSYRLGERAVKDFVERYYFAQFYSFEKQVRFLKDSQRLKKNQQLSPCKAKYMRNQYGETTGPRYDRAAARCGLQRVREHRAVPFLAGRA